MTAIARWTGAEVRALRHARRMSVRTFADHLGVSDRMVSKWEAARDAIQPRAVNRAALDTSLAMADATVRARFARLVAGAADFPLYPNHKRMWIDQDPRDTSVFVATNDGQDEPPPVVSQQKAPLQVT